MAKEKAVAATKTGTIATGTKLKKRAVATTMTWLFLICWCAKMKFIRNGNIKKAARAAAAVVEAAAMWRRWNGRRCAKI